MNSLELNLLIQSIKPLLKEQGFKKSNLSWHKVTEEIILVLNIRISQWGPEFYINVGVYIRALGSEDRPPESRCHVWSRINHDSIAAEKLIDVVFQWFDEFGSIFNLQNLAKRDKLPPVTVLKAKEFLHSLG